MPGFSTGFSTDGTGEKLLPFPTGGVTGPPGESGEPGSDGGDDQTADLVPYDNSGSGLTSTDVQNALDELAAQIALISDGGGGASESADHQDKIYPDFVTPIDGDFAWINQGAASVIVNANGGIDLEAPASAGANLRIRKKAAPATPYTITAAFIIRSRLNDFQKGGLCWRQSSDGKVIIHSFFVGNAFSGDCGVTCQDYTNPTTFSAVNISIDTMPFGVQFLRITDDGTNRIVSWSTDGYNFVTLLSELRTTFLTADEVGFFCDNTNSIANGITLLSWEQT